MCGQRVSARGKVINLREQGGPPVLGPQLPNLSRVLLSLSSLLEEPPRQRLARERVFGERAFGERAVVVGGLSSLDGPNSTRSLSSAEPPSFPSPSSLLPDHISLSSRSKHVYHSELARQFPVPHHRPQRPYVSRLLLCAFLQLELTSGCCCACPISCQSISIGSSTRRRARPAGKKERKEGGGKHGWTCYLRLRSWRSRRGASCTASVRPFNLRLSLRPMQPKSMC